MAAAVAGGVAVTAAAVWAIVVVVEDVVVVDDDVVVEVEVGSEVAEQQELKVCAVPGATALTGVMPVPGVYVHEA